MEYIALDEGSENNLKRVIGEVSEIGEYNERYFLHDEKYDVYTN